MSNKEVTANALLLGQRIPAGQPLDHRGRLRRAGGFVAEGLCRLLQGRETTIVLVDHDRVEPHNLLRQNFYAEDVGRFKSQALADRLARAYRRPVGYSVYPFREEDSRPDGGRYPGLPAYGNSLLMKAAPTTPPDADCAAALDLTDQDPTINQMMASLALQVVRRIVAGACLFMGLYPDMEQGTVTPTYATPEAVVRVVRTDAASQ